MLGLGEAAAFDSLALWNKAGFDAVPEKVMPSRTARCYRKNERRSRRRWRLEVIGCQGRYETRSTS